MGASTFPVSRHACVLFDFDSIKRFSDIVSDDGQNNSRFHRDTASFTARAPLR